MGDYSRLKTLPKKGRGRWIGTQIHQGICNYYQSQHPSEAAANDIACDWEIATIFRRYLVNVRQLPMAGLYTRPDIVNIRLGEIYEIKPLSLWFTAKPQLLGYIGIFHGGGVSLMPGPSNDPGVSGIVAAPAGYVVFVSPEPGVIIYRKYNGNFMPRSVAAPQGALSGAATIAVEGAAAASGGAIWIGKKIWDVISGQPPAGWPAPVPGT